MKKLISTFLFSLFAVIACAFTVGANELTASATNDFSVSVQKISAAEVTGTQAGDFKATVNLENISSDGLCIVSYRLYYDTVNFELVMASEDEPCHTYGAEIAAPLHQFNATTVGYVVCAYISFSGNYYPDGELFSVYLRPKNNSTDITPITGIEIITVQTKINSSFVELPYLVSANCEINPQYRVGDANQNGSVQVNDVLYINTVIANANGATITKNNYMNYLPTSETDEDLVFFALLDINEDGVLTEADSNAILNALAGYPATGALYEYRTLHAVIDVID